MYKSFRTKKYRIAFNKFRKNAKTISRVYLSGARNWEAQDSKNYSLVLGTFRIMFAINKSEIGQSGGL